MKKLPREFIRQEDNSDYEPEIGNPHGIASAATILEKLTHI
jgi:hypothetical protein